MTPVSANVAILKHILYTKCAYSTWTMSVEIWC